MGHRELLAQQLQWELYNINFQSNNVILKQCKLNNVDLPYGQKFIQVPSITIKQRSFNAPTNWQKLGLASILSKLLERENKKVPDQLKTKRGAGGSSIYSSPQQYPNKESRKSTHTQSNQAWIYQISWSASLALCAYNWNIVVQWKVQPIIHHQFAQTYQPQIELVNRHEAPTTCFDTLQTNKIFWKN